MDNIKTPQEVMIALKELHDASEKKQAEKIEAIQASLNAFEVENQKAVAAFHAAQEEKKAFEDRIAGLEVEIAKAAQEPKSNYRDSAEYKALVAYTKKGFDGISADEIKTLRTDVGTDGGYLVPEMMASEIVKQMEEISPIRQYARVRTMAGKTLNQPIRTGIPTAAYEGEAEQGVDSQSVYGTEQITPFRLSVTVPVTRDQLMDSAFNMESEIMADVALSFAQKEGNKFLLGTNVKEPDGLLINSNVTSTTTAASGTLTLADLIELPGNVKQGYNGMFFFNQKTLATLRAETGTGGRFVWIDNGSQKMLTIDGVPYVIMPDMPNIAAGNKAAGYGDFSRGYHIFDRTAMEMIRDDYTQKRSAIIELTFHRWNTGRVVLPEAFRLATVKA